MARRVLLKCEQCGKQEVILEKLDQASAAKALETMPRGWRTVVLDLGLGSMSADMCSFKCSVIWARAAIILIIQDAEARGQYIDED